MPGSATALGLGGDFLGGFQDESGKIREDNQRRQDVIDQRNQKVFETLANSDDPEIRAAAVTGLLTGNSPAKGMDKWFSKVQDHPIHETIRNLVGAGHQPFMDPVKRHGAELSADIDAKINSIHGSGLSTDDQRRATLGIYGAPPPRPVAPQAGTLHMKDGSTLAGFFSPSDGEYYDGNYQPVTDAVGFTRGTGTGTGAGGHTTKTVKDASSPTGYSYVRYDDKMQEIGRTPNAPAPGGPETFTGIPTAGGIVRFGNRSGAVSPAPGGEGVERPTTPEADVNALRETEASILRLHPQPKPLFTGGTVDPAKMQAWRDALDEEAQKYKFDSFEALQQKIGGAVEGVGGLTPPPAVPPTLGAKKPTAAAPKANTGRGAIDVQAIIKELSAGKKNTGAAAPAR